MLLVLEDLGVSVDELELVIKATVEVILVLIVLLVVFVVVVVVVIPQNI